ncbi:MAG TPA: hypothetical protein VIF82_07500 [Burkholderiaceae bacterium]|jgi:hypothetical protein
MSVSSATSGVNINPTSLKSLGHQRHKDFEALTSSIQSGGISGAQAALSALQTDMQNIQGIKGVPDASGTQQPSKLQTDFSNLISSIQSGSATGAQSALSTLQQDRHSQIGAASASSQSSFKQDLASLIQAVQAGDLSTAQ